MSSLPELKAAPAIGEARDRELLKDAHSYVYYESPQGDLIAHFFLPPDHNPASWTGATPRRVLEDWCRKEKIKPPQFMGRGRSLVVASHLAMAVLNELLPHRQQPNRLLSCERSVGSLRFSHLSPSLCPNFLFTFNHVSTEIFLN